MKISVEDIKRLRESTGVGLTDAKKALEETKGDFDKALENMRIKGIAKAEKKSERAASAGMVHSYVHGGKIGVLVELNCETDFVAKTEEFKTLANDLALHIAASNPLWVSREDVDSEVLEKEKELFKKEVTEQGKPADMADKIVEGKLEKFLTETCLLEQAFVKNPDQTVGELVKESVAKLGENIVIRRFSRLTLGES